MRQLIRSFAWWILRTVKPGEKEIDAAIRAAFLDCGLPLDDYDPTFAPGPKLYELLIHANRRLGHPFSTVADLRDLLE